MKKAGMIMLIFIILLLAGSICFVYFNRNAAGIMAIDGAAEITGSVEARETDVNLKTPGRVSEIRVEEGDAVTAGQVIATVEAENIRAKAELAKAAREAAVAQYRKAKNGARPQQLAQAQDLAGQAKAGYELAQTTYERLEYLFQEGVLPRQKLDIAKTELEVAQSRYNSAKEQYEMVKEGAQAEDIEAAAAVVRQAQAAYDEVQSYLNDAVVKAPVSGVITSKSVESGELVSTGMPLVTISDLQDVWVEIKIRETALAQFSLGSSVPVKVVGVPGKIYHGAVTYIAAKPSFATERAYQEKGERDLVAFAVKIKLDNKDLKLRPGMTAVIVLKNAGDLR